MTEPPSAAAKNARGDADTWPWRCLGCGGTIYHDGEFCRECRTVAAPGDGSRRHRGGFLDWIRRQSLAALSLKVTVVAGIELALTAFWLQLFLRRSGELVQVVPSLG